ncbi:protein Wnt-11b-2-like [Ischnura elegans]|uniref:protein Wnt-11b-2-like n=1 Tax=Ischnura elegans TaxID=197161 RepID=UPI001ED87778|nr:protein Wnt-11b-2-like [Ischnura elegans]
MGRRRAGCGPPSAAALAVALASMLWALVLGPVEVDAIRWLALRKATGPPWRALSAHPPPALRSASPDRSSVVSAACGRARRSLGLTRAQARLCRRAADAMPLVARAASQTAIVCGELFKERRWNCSSLELAPRLSPDLTTGTREQAFVYALSSASVAFSVSRACASGALFACSCGPTPREPPDGNFKWGGCGDNLKYGLQFGKAWADAAAVAAATPHADEAKRPDSPSRRPSDQSNDVELESRTTAKKENRERLKPMPGRKKQPPGPWRGNCTHTMRGGAKRCRPGDFRAPPSGRGPGRGASGRRVLPVTGDEDRARRKRPPGPPGRRKGPRKARTLLSVVNLHNNRAGRRAVEWSVSTQCKCHGVSGSCSIKTCWKALPRLVDVGERLKRQYAVATEVVPGRGWVGPHEQPDAAPSSSSNVHAATASTLSRHRLRGGGPDLVALPPPGGRRRRLLQPAATAPAHDFNDHHLIYVTKSPDYCSRDPRVGSQGTAGRWCNASSHGHDGCDSMCCGRGFETIGEEVVERCQCKYYWCCYVKCKTCRRWVERHRCK